MLGRGTGAHGELRGAGAAVSCTNFSTGFSVVLDSIAAASPNFRELVSASVDVSVGEDTAAIGVSSLCWSVILVPSFHSIVSGIQSSSSSSSAHFDSFPTSSD